MITLSQLQLAYQQRPVLNISHWRVEPGERVLVHGPSGSGKSTLLHVLAGLLLPQQGRVEILGQTINHWSGRKRDAFRARHLGFIAQQLNLIPYLTVLDNVLLAAHLSQRQGLRHTIKAQAESLLAEVNLGGDVLQQPAHTLSLGQQQRVAIVRAMIHQPQIILADEPTSALDDANRDQFMQQLQRLCEQQNATLVMVSHDLSLMPAFSRVQALHELQAQENN
ncbi:ABC transporter ATP-binding protein [Bacterioplanes sanyensis]|uniref:ABC transporter ATP-binding protein n=1 Tax=Bacterioplanes sanyensis TaxID=1249553 RepID=UPI00167934F6|nr:ATP-binding cassette domain-containing protein [Bacterioplanes sanyensis]